MKLWQVAKLIRSKNAGPFELTFDVILKDRATYEKVRDAKVINAEWFARTYRLKPEVVAIETFLGRVDVRLNVIARDMAQYQQVYRARILMLPHIAEVEALMLIATLKESEGLPL